jgi:hypothetical protein
LVLQRLQDIEIFSKLGNTDGEIAKFLGVSGGTFSEYKRKYPKINEALSRGREILCTPKDEIAEFTIEEEATPSIETALASVKNDEEGDIAELEGLLAATARGGRYQEIVYVPIIENGMQVLDKDGKPKTQIAKIVEKYIPPNFNAIKFSLEKLNAQKWNPKEFKQLGLVCEDVGDGGFEI